jgi:hypothetical protein
MKGLRLFVRSTAVVAVLLLLATAPNALLCTAPERAAIMAGGYGSVHVNVTDEAGRPIIGANITIEYNTTFWNFTGSDGSYLIQGLAAGTYQINATMVGYLPGFTPATVVANEMMNVTITIEGGAFSGFVYTQANAPIENATVEMAVGSTLLFTKSLPDGSFNLTGIPTGSYTVVVFAADFFATSEVVSITAGSTTSRAAPYKLTMTTGWISGYIFEGTTPVPNASVSITIDTTKVTVLSGVVGDYLIPGVPGGVYTVHADKEGYDGSEVINVTVISGFGTEGLNISIVGKPATIQGSVVATSTGESILLYGALIEVLGTGKNATTGTNGMFTIIGVPVGTWTIRISAPGYYENESAGVVVGRGAVLDLNFVLSPKPGQLMGTVKAADTRELLVGYRVTINGAVNRETFTNELGQYVFAGLTPGNYTLTIVSTSSDPIYSPFIKYNVKIDPELALTVDVEMQLAKQALGGFIFGLDLPHSFMVLALILTMIVMCIAVAVRLRKVNEDEKASRSAVSQSPEKKEKEEPPAE